MNLSYKTGIAEIKAGKEKGSFSGLVSVFGNIDSDGDVIDKGAFKKIRTTKDDKLRIALNHDMRQFVGKASYRETDKGLHLEGKLDFGLKDAEQAYALLDGGYINEMSVGFSILKGGREFRENGDGEMIRHITKAELYEGSLVPFAANPEAQIESFQKSATGIKTLRDFEQFLKNAGFSNRDAAYYAKHGFKQSDSLGEQVKSARGILESLSKPLT